MASVTLGMEVLISYAAGSYSEDLDCGFQALSPDSY